MNDFFEEMGWVEISIVGGAVGLAIFFKYLMADGSPLSQVINILLEGLM